METIYRYYITLRQAFYDAKNNLIPYIRRAFRFLALPYAYFGLVNWSECTVSRSQVIKDLLYIFFTLKYFPDNYTPCRLWEVDRNKWKFYYGSIYEPYQRGRLRKFIQRKEYLICFDDKYICYQLCKSFGLPLPQQYALAKSNIELKSLLHSIIEQDPTKRLIIKQNEGKGGKGIYICFKQRDKIVLITNIEIIPIELFSIDSSFVIQEFISQHYLLSNISPSTNTIRFVTFLSSSHEVFIIGAYMRFGINNTFIDNVSRGGISVGIDIQNGTLNQFAYNRLGQRYNNHPTSHFTFNNFQIPFWQAACDLSKQIQQSFSFYRLLGADIAITNTGPVVIEINSSPDMVALEQRCGPILKNPIICREFEENDLFVNRLQRIMQ